MTEVNSGTNESTSDSLTGRCPVTGAENPPEAPVAEEVATAAEPQSDVKAEPEAPVANDPPADASQAAS